MGNKFSRRRDAPAKNAETVTPEQKTTEESAARKTADDSAASQIQVVTDRGNLDVVMEEPATTEGCLSSQQCVSECKEVEDPPAPEPVVEESSTAAQTEILVSATKASPTEPEESLVSPEPQTQGEDVEAVQPTSESGPTPDETLLQQTDLLRHGAPPEPELSSPLVADFGIADVTPSSAPNSDSVTPDEASGVPAGEKDSAELAESSPLEPERCAGTSESPKELIEVEAAEFYEKHMSDANEERASEILKALELKGNDLVTDFMLSDVKLPDDTPFIDVSASNELI
ncbi:uncharacterized protein KZ484_010091 [Pholidichthys leucotaenia]